MSRFDFREVRTRELSLQARQFYVAEDVPEDSQNEATIERIHGDLRVILHRRIYSTPAQSKTVEFAFSSPLDWWEHLKLTLQTLWPEAFGWLRPRFGLQIKSKTVYAIALFPDLPVEPGKMRTIIQWTDGRP
jgi:hypothetical protein